MKWNELRFWQTGECQVIREKLDDLRKANVTICPQRREIFKALKETPYETVKVVVFGQDPYPNPAHATGIAFSIPVDVASNNYPPTLKNVLKEYKDDLGYPEPKNGSLEDWAHKGVLLLNAIPSCTAFQSGSHDWTEWETLNSEIIETLERKDECVFVFLGTVAKRYLPLVKFHPTIYCSHPSPRSNLSSKTPFLGSKLFSQINSHLKEPIDWRLP